MKTIFIVDDSDTNLLMAEEALEDHYRIITIPSAVKMFPFLEKIKPDLILLDIEMPIMNGFEALEKLNGLQIGIPVVFLTGTINAEIEKRCSELGAAGIIAKPFSASSLVVQIKSYF